MSNVPHKVEWKYQHTETVYYNAKGEEIDRERHDDDYAYDSGDPISLTEQEIKEWMPAVVEHPCDECGEEATEFWPNLKKPVQLCASCEHNARRSGWEPGR